MGNCCGCCMSKEHQNNVLLQDEGREMIVISSKLTTNLSNADLIDRNN